MLALSHSAQWLIRLHSGRPRHNDLWERNEYAVVLLAATTSIKLNWIVKLVLLNGRVRSCPCPIDSPVEEPLSLYRSVRITPIGGQLESNERVMRHTIQPGHVLCVANRSHVPHLAHNDPAISGYNLRQVTYFQTVCGFRQKRETLPRRRVTWIKKDMHELMV